MKVDYTIDRDTTMETIFSRNVDGQLLGKWLPSYMQRIL